MQNFGNCFRTTLFSKCFQEGPPKSFAFYSSSNTQTLLQRSEVAKSIENGEKNLNTTKKAYSKVDRLTPKSVLIIFKLSEAQS